MSAALLTLALAEGIVGPPTTSRHLSSLVLKHVHDNTTLLRYFFPEKPVHDVHANWVGNAGKCVVSQNCWCTFVQGSQDKDVNPNGGDRCETVDRLGHNATHTTIKSGRMGKCSQHHLRCRTTCFTGKGAPCLYTMMAPTKLLSVIALARAAGVTHIVEEGRAGGLSAYIYWLHGFEVTSIEYAPIDEVQLALKQWAPSIRILNGDGHELVPQVIEQLGEAKAAKTLVFFDGEKREAAYDNTFSLIKQKVALGLFDDSDLGSFHNYLQEKESVWWSYNTSHPFVLKYEAKQKELYKDVVLIASGMKSSISELPGGANNLGYAGFFAAVKGGAWK